MPRPSLLRWTMRWVRESAFVLVPLRRCCGRKKVVGRLRRLGRCKVGAGARRDGAPRWGSTVACKCGSVYPKKGCKGRGAQGVLELAPAREKKRVWAASGRQESHYPLAVLERSTLHVRGQGAQGAGGRGSAGAEGQAAGGASAGSSVRPLVKGSKEGIKTGGKGRRILGREAGSGVGG